MHAATLHIKETVQMITLTAGESVIGQLLYYNLKTIKH